jgi:hypothetical protein
MLYVNLANLINVLMPSSASITDGPLDMETVEAILRAAIGSAARDEAYDATYTDGETGIDSTLTLLNQVGGE